MRNNSGRSLRLDPARHNFQTKFGLALTAVSLVLLFLLSVFTADNSSSNNNNYYSAQSQSPHSTKTSSSSSSSSSNNPNQHRWLDQANDDANNDDDIDYSSHSCGYMYEETPNPGQARCQFARTCNQGAGIWAPFVFCSATLSETFLVSLISPVIVLWLVLLFRMLGSTAEDYFSPALEMFSVKLGLPPRFAGVTLLALGNGAADVSATVSAITADPVAGYKLSMGALTGAAMVIGCVVSAVVVLVAGGVPCRGALVRDVAALTVACLFVWREFAKGIIGPDAVTLFLSLYGVFVALVLCADVYHRAVVLPRRRGAAQQQERERQFHEQHTLTALHSDPTAAVAAAAAIDTPATDIPTSNDRFSNLLTAFSNYDNDPDLAGWGVESDDLRQDRPVVLHGSHGILRGDGHLLNNINNDSNNDGDQQVQGGTDGHANYSMLEDAHDVCISTGSSGISATNWWGAFHDAQQELTEHAAAVWEDIVWNGDINAATKFLLLCELPFTTLRKLTVPIPCEGYYVRALVALSLSLSPLWFCLYLWHGHDINVLRDGGWLYFLALWGLFLFGSCLILRYAPDGEGNMALHISTPIALFGFAIAATWIDTIADCLVSCLSFVGLVLKIPAPVVGLTILAWGNSMGDLSANMTMARKGLANMAMTACFAGPLFNVLVGLGFGFSSLAAQTGNAEASVVLSPSVVTGFLFIIANAVTILTTGLLVGKGRIPQKYGYIALTLYTIYVVSSITLQYSKYGDE